MNNIEGGYWSGDGCIEGSVVATGAECSFVARAGYYCAAKVPTAQCVNTHWEQTPNCVKASASRCPLPHITGSYWNGLGCNGQSVPFGTRCSVQARPGYSCTNGGFSIECLANGLMSLPVQCSPVPGVSVMCPVPIVNHGTWSGDGCVPGLYVDVGISCVFTAHVGYTCSEAGPRVCTSVGTWNIPDPQCVSSSNSVATCTVPEIRGGKWTGCTAGSVISSGRTCTFIEKVGFTCTSTGDRYCYSGLFDHVPTCRQSGQLKCEVPYIEGGTWLGGANCTANGVQNIGQSCYFSKGPGYLCTGVGARLCNENVVWDEVPLCVKENAPCNVPVINGGSWLAPCTGQTAVPSGTQCVFLGKNEFTCENEGATTCYNGAWTQVPSCFRPGATCVVYSVEGGFWGGGNGSCVGGSQIAHGQSCFFGSNQGYVCEPNGYTSCVDGNWVPTPQCSSSALECIVPDINGGYWEGCSSGLGVTNGHVCTFYASPGYTCTNTGHRTCINGAFDRVPACVGSGNQCKVSNIIGGNWIGSGCTVDSLVNSGTQCVFVGTPGYLCIGAGARVCSNGEWDQMPSCSANNVPCTVPAVVGGIWSKCFVPLLCATA